MQRTSEKSRISWVSVRSWPLSDEFSTFGSTPWDLGGISLRQVIPKKSTYLSSYRAGGDTEQRLDDMRGKTVFGQQLISFQRE